MEGKRSQRWSSPSKKRAFLFLGEELHVGGTVKWDRHKEEERAAQAACRVVDRD